jgi:hypothetical protein
LIARHTGHQRKEQSWVYIVELYLEQAERPETIIAVKRDQPHKLINEWKNYKEFIEAKGVSSSFFIRPHLLWPTEEEPELLISQYAGNLGPRYVSIQSFNDFCRDNLSDHPERVMAVLIDALACLGELYEETEKTFQKEVERYGQVYFTFEWLSLFIHPEGSTSSSPPEESDNMEKSRQRAEQIRADLKALIDEGTSLSDERIRVDGEELLNPLVSLRKVLGMCPRYLKCAATHGDLHGNNLLVVASTGVGDKTSHYQSCLIDYERMAERDENGEVKEFLPLEGRHHIARDFAHFETEFLNHVVSQELQPEKDVLFVSALHDVTKNGFKDSEIKKAVKQLSDNSFVSHAFELVCFLRQEAFQVLKRQYDRGYDGQDYMVALFLDALNSLWFELSPRQKKLALVNCATALAAIVKIDPPPLSTPERIDIKYSLIGRHFYQDWIGDLNTTDTDTVRETIRGLTAGLAYMNPSAREKIQTLKSLYCPRTSRFLVPAKTLREEGIRHNEFLVLSDYDDTPDNGGYIDAILQLLVKMGKLKLSE